MHLRIKRIYDDPSPDDGARILIDRVWPRGVSKEAARLDEWERDLAPSKDLRVWFGHRPERFEEFRRRYVEELRDHRDELSALRARARKSRVTLLFGAHDTEHNNAVVLAEVLRRGLPKAG